MLVFEVDWMVRMTVSRSSVKNMCCKGIEEEEEEMRRKRGKQRMCGKGGGRGRGEREGGEERRGEREGEGGKGGGDRKTGNFTYRTIKTQEEKKRTSIHQLLSTVKFKLLTN